MKKQPVFLASALVTVAAGVALAQDIKVEKGPVVKEVPMTWQQASINDGEQLYGELCAACHGKTAEGDGPAAGALKKLVPDLTLLAARNSGEFPRKRIEDAITGENRVASHGSVDMPMWGSAFEGVRPDWKPARRKAFAKQRVFNLTEYLSSLQVD
ncbi:MAG: c-type cytochrome [Pseudomonadota bacterium]